MYLGPTVTTRRLRKAAIHEGISLDINPGTYNTNSYEEYMSGYMSYDRALRKLPRETIYAIITEMILDRV